MHCPSCGHENLDDALFCEQCAAEFGPICPSCRTRNQVGARFCRQCREPLASTETPAAPAFTPTPTPAPAVPSSFVSGRYQVRRFLGEGGKKRVYLAHDTRLDRDVAFSLIKTEGLDASGLARVRREAQAMGRLGDHPNVVTVFDIGEEAGQPCIVSQYMEGGSVEDLIDQAPDHRLPIDQCLQIACEVCQALSHAHERGIIHRDIKPGNIWLTTDGHAKLGDFGLAVAIDLSRLTQAGMMVGTVAYMPPEQALGGRVDTRSDLYGLGATLYEMVTGRPPFSGHDPVAVVSQHLNTPPVAPSFHNPSLPPALNDLILKLLAKNPEDRPSSADEVLAVLQTLREQMERGEVVAQAEPAAVTPIGRVAWGTFVGRQKEMEQLRERLADAFSGRGSVVMVVGDAGIGKTRLLQEFATYARLRGAQVLWGAAYQGEARLPYGPFAEALQEYVSRTSVETLRRAATEGSSVLVPLAPELKAKLPDLPEPSPVPPEAEAYRLFQEATEFLLNASTSAPVLLVLEDLQWADKGTCSLLQHLARRPAGSRLLVTISCREAELERGHHLREALVHVRRESGFWELPLKGLRESEVRELITVLAEHEVPQPLILALHEETEGNPFFVQETLKHLIETEALYQEEGRWTSKATTISDVGVPGSVRDVVESRLAGLSAEARRLLQVGSVLGRRFSFSVICRVLDLDQESVLRALDEALARQLVMEQREDGRLHYRFTHAVIRECLYEDLSGPRRQRLHSRAARELEDAYSNRLQEYAAELAYHYQQAGEMGSPERALEYWVKAAEQASTMYAHEEAASHFSQALQIIAGGVQIPRRELAELLFKRGRAQLGAGNWSGAALSWKEALPEYEAVEDKELAARVCRELAYLLTWRGQAEEALACVERGLALVGTNSDVGIALVAQKAAACMMLGRASEALEAAEMAASQVSGIGDVGMKAWTASTAGIPLIAYLACETALSLATEGEAWARAVNNPYTAASCIGLQALALAQLGRWVEGMEIAKRLLPLARQVGNYPNLALGQAFVSMYRAGRGEFEEAERQAEEALRLAREMSLVSALPGSLEAAAAPRLFTGRLEEAEERLRQLDVVFELAGRPAVASPGWPRMVRLRLDSGDTQGAEEMLAAKPDWLRPQEPLDIRLAAGLANLAELYLELGHLHEAVSLKQALGGIIERRVLTPYSAYFPLPYRLLGMIDSAQSRWTEAEDNFHKAVELCETNGLRVELAATLLWYAKMRLARDAPGDAEAATAMLSEALRLYQDMGLPQKAERVLAVKMQAQEKVAPDLTPSPARARTTPRSTIEQILPSALADAPSLARHSDERGTVTILFTDIEGSTALAQRLGDKAYHALLAEHNRILREQLARHGGHEVKHTGDGFMVAFASAARALSCAVDIQRAFAARNAAQAEPVEAPINVRIGLNTGESIEEAGDYFGTAVTLAARIADRARGGQILVSDLLRNLAGSLAGVEFSDAGRKQLKGIAGRKRVYEVRWQEG
jgi:class 3 adenylate cyclase